MPAGAFCGLSRMLPSVIGGAGGCFTAAPWANGTDRRLTPKLFSFAQEPIEIDGLVKIPSGLKPNRIHESRRRKVSA